MNVQKLLTDPLRRLFEAEIANGLQGGANPATLTSTIDSVNQAPDDTFGLGYRDLVALLLIRDQASGDTEVRSLL